MKENQIRRMIVRNGDKRLVGIVALGDPAADTNDERLTVAALRQVFAPAQLDTRIDAAIR